jgi:hypothetical protein
MTRDGFVRGMDCENCSRSLGDYAITLTIDSQRGREGELLLCKSCYRVVTQLIYGKGSDLAADCMARLATATEDKGLS